MYPQDKNKRQHRKFRTTQFLISKSTASWAPNLSCLIVRIRTWLEAARPHQTWSFYSLDRLCKGVATHNLTFQFSVEYYAYCLALLTPTHSLSSSCAHCFAPCKDLQDQGLSKTWQSVWCLKELYFVIQKTGCVIDKGSPFQTWLLRYQFRCLILATQIWKICPVAFYRCYARKLWIGYSVSVILSN